MVQNFNLAAPEAEVQEWQIWKLPRQLNDSLFQNNN